MSCAVAHSLMDEALDGDKPPELAAHLASCPSCAVEWSRLLSLEILLQRPGQPRPPAGFHSRTMARLDRGLASPWLARADVRVMLSVVTVLTGVLLVLVGVAMVLQTVGRPDEVAGWLDVARALGGWGFGVFGRLAAPAGATMVTWTVYGILALTLALMWFGALVVPRRIPNGLARR